MRKVIGYLMILIGVFGLLTIISLGINIIFDGIEYLTNQDDWEFHLTSYCVYVLIGFFGRILVKGKKKRPKSNTNLY